MTFVTADRIVFLWAHRNSYDCEFSNTAGALNPSVRVQLNHATAYLRDGRLVRLDTRRDGRFSNELAAELANLFALCGYLELRRTDVGVEQDKRPEQEGAASAESSSSAPPPRRGRTGIERVMQPRVQARRAP